MFLSRFVKFSLLIVLLFSTCVAVYAGDYQVGVYYFPGWNSNSAYWNDLKGLPGSRSPGKAWPDREPLLGFNYREEDPAVAEKHLQWMHGYGIDFIVYDWYWNKDKTTKLDHALKAHIKARNSKQLKFSILWANHSEVPENLDQFTAMVDYWIKNYFNKKQFMTIDGRPVVYIFSPGKLRDNAKKFGKSTKDLFDISRNLARKAGFKGIYFVACTQALDTLVKDYIPRNDYDAMSAYNYHRGYSGKYEKGGLSTNYSELMSGYMQSWQWILNNSQLPYFVPVTAGWNSKPWGSNTPHDESISDPSSFKNHLLEAKAMLDRYPDKTMKTVVICAWNEFGEGSYIEPTKKWQFQYLQAIKDVFGN